MSIENFLLLWFVIFFSIFLYVKLIENNEIILRDIFKGFLFSIFPPMTIVLSIIHTLDKIDDINFLDISIFKLNKNK